jgi:hypothetical protein
MRILISLSVLALTTILPAQSAASLKGTFNAAAVLDDLRTNNVTAFMTWKAGELPGEELPVIVAQSPTAPTPEMLRIYSLTAENPALLTSHGELGGFASFFATRPRGGLLVTLWALSATRTKVVIFAYREHDVHAVLEAESDGLPEFVRMSSDAEPAVRVTIAAAGGRAAMPVQTLYRWNGKTYQPARALRAPASGTQTKSAALRRDSASPPKPK